MTSTTIAPSLSQGQLQLFQDNFHSLVQQRQSRLMASNAIKFLPSQGKTHNMSRIGRLELDEVNTRNPDKQFGDYNLDNRRFTKRRFTKTIQIDAKDDINELITDPTSSLVEALASAQARVVDRVAIAAAVGDVLTGAADEAATSTSAAADGVITIDATSSGFDYATVQKIIENYINNDLEDADMFGSVVCLSGAENTDLMTEDKFINSDYISGRPVEQGKAQSAGMFDVKMFAGSVTGGIQVTNPILPEGATKRSNVVMAPNALVMAIELGNIRVEDSNSKVNSKDITVDLWVNAMRTEGALVQIVETSL